MLLEEEENGAHVRKALVGINEGLAEGNSVGTGTVGTEGIAVVGSAVVGSMEGVAVVGLAVVGSGDGAEVPRERAPLIIVVPEHDPPQSQP